MKYTFITLLYLAFAITTARAANAQSQGEKQPAAKRVGASNKIDFWKTQKKGANFFNHNESPARFTAAKKIGIDFVRLAPNKWLNDRPANGKGDFLIGAKGKYSGINVEDLERLKAVLDDAETAGLKVVLTMLSLPKRRWTQHNGSLGQERALWQAFENQTGSIEFWRSLADSLKDHSAIVGYNILNEPSPEKTKPLLGHVKNSDAHWKAVKGTPRDLNLFYEKVIDAIRSVDKSTPIILDAGDFADLGALAGLDKQRDPKVLYSFHFYTPYKYTLGKAGAAWHYPGLMGAEKKNTVGTWNALRIEKAMERVDAFLKTRALHPWQILVGEFRVRRDRAGAHLYLRDLISIFNARNWHWAFYSFREDDWDKVDYELGPGKELPKGYYWRREKGDPFPGKSAYKKNIIFDEILRGLKDQTH